MKIPLLLIYDNDKRGIAGMREMQFRFFNLMFNFSEFKLSVVECKNFHFLTSKDIFSLTTQ